MKTYHDIASDGGSRILEQVSAQQERLTARLSSVRRIVAIASGKGGVGKSTLTAMLAAALGQQSCRVGILDADLNGPSMAHMMGVRRHVPIPANGSVSPALAANDVAVMSMDMFLPADSTPLLWRAPSQQNAFTWRSMVEMSALRELLSDTDWGKLDVLLIDLPPGSDRIQNLADLLPDLSGVIIVTTPAAVAQMVVSRSITLATDVAGLAVIGLVENMTSFACPVCSHQQRLFPAAPDTRSLAEEHDLAYLGSIPFDSQLARQLDHGRCFVSTSPDSPASRAIFSVARSVHTRLNL
ncbi:MAG: P-loop NTPase [Bacteroidota bacterium]|nr:P-loop NTPase [Bacteroidota bacterium]MDE2957293.1 P-loop NTPase [Bacteroidota bacterium]